MRLISDFSSKAHYKDSVRVWHQHFLLTFIQEREEELTWSAGERTLSVEEAGTGGGGGLGCRPARCRGAAVGGGGGVGAQTRQEAEVGWGAQICQEVEVGSGAQTHVGSGGRVPAI